VYGLEHIFLYVCLAYAIALVPLMLLRHKPLGIADRAGE
jgi:heme exporter protein D